MNVGLEDFHEDILGKAMRGLGIGKNEMAIEMNIEKSAIDSILNGSVDEDIIRSMASFLKLDGEKLVKSARKGWFPNPVLLEGFQQLSSSYGEMIVNAYVFWDKTTKKAWIFDTGTNPFLITKFVDKKSLEIDAIFLTHTHNDHIACLDDLKQKTNHPPIFVHKSETFDECESIEEGFCRNLGDLSLKALHTHGHSIGGLTYQIAGLGKPVAIVGDAIFAGSMGGGMVSYKNALRTNKEKIMALPDETIICPGHGPMTTVGEERENNPFF